MLAPSTEFARPIEIEPWPDVAIAVELVADARERQALARRFGLLELGALRIDGRLEPGEDRHELRFRGSLEAAVVQACVATLEPVPARIRTPVERRYRRQDAGPARREFAAEPHLWLVDPDEVEVEPVSGPTIDLGEAMAEELALALDPYPRAADADDLVLTGLGPNISVGDEAPAETPFAALRQLRQKRAR